ncbi:MAG: hypothetical protein KDD61_12115 [Bdellovibrionales bacterium]|nr:hypothetical protein [Bdellovibrionales bacterium]
MKRLLLVCSLMIVSLSACVNDDSSISLRDQIPENQRIGTHKVYILEGNDSLFFNNGNLSGTGIVRQATPLKDTYSANRFLIQFSLPETGTLTFLSYGNPKLSNGIELVFSHMMPSHKFSVLYKSPTHVVDLSRSFAHFSPSQLFTLSLEIHNELNNRTQLIVREVRTSKSVLIGTFDISGNGLGEHWGLFLQDASIYNFHVEPL